MEIAKIIYNGDLRTSAQHLKSGVNIITDAPTDNHGKGEAFSPTDLLSTSLGSCMITLMGITANSHNIQLGKIEAKIGKHMGTNPRRVVQIDVELMIEDLNYTKKDKAILENAALSCPVAKSLHPEIVQNIRFEFFKG